ncbi:DUF3331 domain-containing protein [Paraburkholderia bryophila]|uniref:DUF3331 domain-containing protein n=1 Tax=Paraburkholderia bryophila TaxID=420952 RepID=UPI00234A64B9|nr:DUF3331 domain-containing protein [Paraburkholderia bryophila]WCM18356.1 DUF3331 domain-containing protein [Paraburkholderia bryophila]
MADQVEDDIVQRALISLLMPAEPPKPASTGKQRRITNRQTTGTTTVAAANWRLPQVAVVESRSSKSLKVCWSDACSGRYGDQIWAIGVARKAAHCVLTGSPIRRGDTVFRPRVYKSYLPSNRDRMILASVLATYCAEQDLIEDGS